MKRTFHYPITYLYLDLDELPEVIRTLPLLSARRFGCAGLRRRDHLGGEHLPLDQSVRSEVEAHTGVAPTGPVRMLTLWSSWGFYFSPITLYYCLSESANSIDAVVAEVSNTPWRERHTYVLWDGNRVRSGGRQSFEHAKEFHVSPFLDMGLRYRWQIAAPSERLSLHLVASNQESPQLDATLSLSRRPLTNRQWLLAVARYPIVPLRVLAGIYYEAFRLWLNKVPFYPHPTTPSTADLSAATSAEGTPVRSLPGPDASSSLSSTPCGRGG